MRVEILANGKQRRHWSPDDRTRIHAETSAAGAKVSDVARKHGIADEMDNVAVKSLHPIEVRDNRGDTTEAVLEIQYRRIRVLPPSGCPASAPMRQIRRVEEESDCLAGQAEICRHERLSRNIALRIVMSLRATAMRAMSFGFPAATSLSRKLLSCGL